MTAKIILQKYLEYTVNWGDSVCIKTNKPAIIRQKQLIALMKAFNLLPSLYKHDVENFNLDFFTSGQFIETFLQENNEIEIKLSKYIDVFIIKSPNAIRLESMRNHLDYQIIFIDLLHFRKNIQLFFKNNGIRHEGFGSISMHFCNYYETKIMNILDNEKEEIDEILDLIINPLQKEIEEQFLIENYDYPTDNDVKKVDLDWAEDFFI